MISGLRQTSFAALFLVAAIPVQAGQAQELPRSTDGSDPSRWSARGTALIAAPGNHKVIYEDDNIRILSVTVPVNGAEPLHWHPYYSVLVFDEPARIVNRDSKGKAFEGTFIALQRTPSGKPFVGIQAPQSSHSIKNLDRTPVHLTRIEFKHGIKQPTLVPQYWGDAPMPISTDGTDPRQWQPGEESLVAAASHHRVIYEDAAIRILSVTDPPGVNEPPHRHGLPAVLVFDRPARTELHGADGNPMHNELSVDRWPTVMMLPAQGLHWISNPDSQPEHLTRIEFKRGFPQ